MSKKDSFIKETRGRKIKYDLFDMQVNEKRFVEAQGTAHVLTAAKRQIPHGTFRSWTEETINKKSKIVAIVRLT